MTDAKEMINCVRRLYDEVFTKGNVKACDELCTSNIKLHDTAVSNFTPGIASYKETENAYNKAFPTKKTKIEDIFAVDDKVVVRWSCTGKQDGELQGIAPTHRTFTITGISIYKFTNGKISEAWQSWDRLGMLEQLGVVQPAYALH